MYVICYDITKTKVRNKIFKELKNYGKHTQYSVFECNISKKQLQVLMNKLQKLMEKEEEGNIRIYTLCEKCYAQSILIGKDPEADADLKELDMIFV